MDNLTKDQRSRCMSRIRSKNTRPEKVVRKILKKLGFKYKLHVDGLPGKPDILILRRNTAIFINGCFWHQHTNCKRKSMPKANVRYWRAKLKRNVDRQKEDLRAIRKLGWNVLIVWECQVENEEALTQRTKKYLCEKR